MLSPPKTNTRPSPITVAVGYQRVTLMSAAFDHVLVCESKSVASLMPLSAETLPPTTSVRPSGSRMCPEQNRFAAYGTATNVPLDGFQIRCVFGASAQASIASTLPVGCRIMWTATSGHDTGADHWPTWSGGGPAGPAPAPQAESGPSLNCDPCVHVCARAARPVAFETSAVPAPPRSRNLSVPAPLGPSTAIQ